MDYLKSQHLSYQMMGMRLGRKVAIFPFYPPGVIAPKFEAVPGMLNETILY